MKRKAGSSSRKGRSTMKGSLARHVTVRLGSVSFIPHHHQQQQRRPPSANPSRFENLLDSQAGAPVASDSVIPPSSLLDSDPCPSDDKDFILSQDFFCTPDYITPDAPASLNGLDCDKENLCPNSPDKQKIARSKRQRQDDILANTLGSTLTCHQQIVGLADDTFDADEPKNQRTTKSQRNHSYVSQSAVALRCRVMPPPCIQNPYLEGSSKIALDSFGNSNLKCTGLFDPVVGADGLSRYRTDFHEIEQIGCGNFSSVFKVLKRIDGCFYALKLSKQLNHDADRHKALMEVQALAALGYHENIVGYYSSWFENNKLYIQMELCDYSLSGRSTKLFTEAEVLEAMHQIAKALQFMHERGVAHLDVKPDNIYVKKGVYKLGDFGCATLLNGSLPIEEGDARYMPPEILNDKHDHLDKVDIFSLGATIYELVRGSTLPNSGSHFQNLREGKLLLLPGHSVQFQNLLKVMMDPDPVKRPSAQELLENPIFDKPQRTTKYK